MASSRALLVGLNTFKNFPDNPLKGCVNDVTDMAAYLKTKAGFGVRDIHELTNEKATANAIASGIKTLLKDMQAGDRAIFHFSGHGTQVMQGGKAHDTIVPYDFDYDKSFTYMTDQTFDGLFAGINSRAHVVWVADSCHSGNLTRMLPREGAQGPMARHLPIPAALQAQIDHAIQQNLVAPQIRAIVDKLNLSLLTACKSGEEAEDSVFDGRDNGAFTHFLIANLSAKASLTEVIAKVTRAITAAKIEDQHPEVRGVDAAKSHPIFYGEGVK
jgi:hypothetical protein